MLIAQSGPLRAHVFQAIRNYLIPSLRSKVKEAGSKRIMPTRIKRIDAEHYTKLMMAG